MYQPKFEFMLSSLRYLTKLGRTLPLSFRERAVGMRISCASALTHVVTVELVAADKCLKWVISETMQTLGFAAFEMPVFFE